MCNKCITQVNENKEFDAFLNLLERETPNEYGCMLPYFKKNDDLFLLGR